MTDKTSKMKLYYFANFRGVTGPARSMLDYGDIPYTLATVPFDGYTEKHSHKFPMGQMPVMEFENGEMICQSHAINLYAAKLAGLYPEDPVQASYAYSVAYCMLDAFDRLKYMVLLLEDSEQKPQAKKKFIEEFCPKHFKNLDKYIQKTGTPGYSVGNSLTFADFFVAEYMDFFNLMLGKQTPFLEYGTFKAIYETVAKAKAASKGSATEIKVEDEEATESN